MKRLMIAALAVLAACGGTASPAGAPKPATLPKTREELTKGQETSHYADVIAFLDSLQKLGVPMYRTVLGTTTEGRVLPLVVLSRPLVKTPAEAHALGRPIVYVEANIHSNEVEGKEALQALIRDLATAKSPGLLDSIVLIAVPIYNADGNEKFAPQAVNRPEQNGPEMIGEGTNGQGLNLNRDFVKAEAPETRGALTAIVAWDPDVFMDLHTTDGSFHGYALTYSPSLNPAALFGGPYARDTILPAVRKAMQQKHGFLVYDYGNFSQDFRDVLTDTVKRGWYTYDSRPRFGTNYLGVRGRITVLAEGYSHDPFDRRVASMYWFVDEVLSFVAQHGPQIVALSKRADSTVVAWGAAPGSGPAIPLRSSLAETREDSVIFEELVSTGDSSLTQPGVPRGLKRTGHFRTQKMPVYVTFEATLTRRFPFAYAIPSGDTAARRLLGLHGVKLDTLAEPLSVTVQRFIVDSVSHAARPFQGHHETAVAGRWRDTLVTLPAGTVLVRTAQPLGVAAFYLLEPESDDGLVVWNVFDAALAPGFAYPVLRIPGAISTKHETH